jgi:hypothetical protein
MFCLKEEQEKQCVRTIEDHRATHHFALAYWYIFTGVKANVLFFNNKPASKEA